MIESLGVKWARLQRAAVIAEIAAVKGHIPSFEEAMKVVDQMSTDIKLTIQSMLRGDENGRQEERESTTNPRREVNPKKQPGNKTKSKGR